VYNQQLKKGANTSEPLTTASGTSDSDSSSSDDMSAPETHNDFPENEYDGKSPSNSLEAAPIKKKKAPPPRKITNSDSDSSSTDDSDDDSDSDSDSDSHSTGAPSGGKNYNNLRVSGEIKELFKFVDQFKPTESELPTHLKPFLPDYIPWIGVPDLFLKVPRFVIAVPVSALWWHVLTYFLAHRPDGAPEKAGLERLDEPAAVQTDKNIFEMQLRSQSKVCLFMANQPPTCENDRCP